MSRKDNDGRQIVSEEGCCVAYLNVVYFPKKNLRHSVAGFRSEFGGSQSQSTTEGNVTNCFTEGPLKRRGIVCGQLGLAMPSLLSWWRVSIARTGHLNNQDSIPVKHSVLCSNHQFQTGSAASLLTSIRWVLHSATN